MKLCDYGCGQEAKYQFKNGKWCCSKTYHSCPSKKKIQSESQKNRMDIDLMKERGRKLGKNNIGKTASYETKEKLSKIQKEIAKDPEERNRRRIQQIEYHKRMSKKEKTEYSLLRSNYNIKRLKRKHPLLFKIEEIEIDPVKKDILAHCKNHNCPNSKEKGGWFALKGKQLEQRLQAIEKPFRNEENNFYCSEKCKQECPLYGFQPSSDPYFKKDPQLVPSMAEYQLWRSTVLERDDYKCQYCGEPAEHVHHIQPQKTHPLLALDPDNGLSVCSNCHYKYGHTEECSTGHLAQIQCRENLK